jgi:DNA-binding FadR family transcriptional regulator
MATEVGQSQAYRTVAHAIAAGKPDEAAAAARELLEPATTALVAALTAMEDQQ